MFATLSSTDLRPGLLVSLAVLLLSLVLGRASLALHDACGALVPAPALPAAVLTVDVPGDAPHAAEAARRAGARAVWTADPALAAGSEAPRLAPGLLVEGLDGRLREVAIDDHRVALPLPEGLRGLLRLDAGQLGDGSPATLLHDRDVVLVSRTTSLEQVGTVGGQRGPVQLGELLAVALGVRDAPTLGLRRLPAWLAPTATALLALLWSLGLSRLSLHRGVLAVTGLLVATGLAALLSRVNGVDLPVGGLLGALALPLVARTWRVCDAALEAMAAIRLTLPPTALEGGPSEGGPSALGGLLRAFSERQGGQVDPSDPPTPSRDPELVGLATTRAATLGALRDASRSWTILEAGDAPVACLRADGRILAAGRRLRAHLGERGAPHQHPAGLAWSEDLRSELNRLLEATRTGAEAATLATPGGDALRVTPVRTAGQIQGFLVEAQDASSARSLRETLSGTQLALSGAVRDAMTAVQGLSARMATENRRIERGILLEKVGAVQEELVRILEMVEGAVTGSGVPGPVQVDDHLRRTWELLPEAVRARVSLERLPPSRPALARSDQLNRAVGLLLVDAASYGDHVSVAMIPEPNHVTIRIRDTGGGLPELVHSRSLNQDGPSAIELVRGLLAGFGAELELAEEPGADRVVIVRLAYA